MHDDDDPQPGLGAHARPSMHSGGSPAHGCPHVAPRPSLAVQVPLEQNASTVQDAKLSLSAHGCPIDGITPHVCVL
jgi:hypothetical protein